MRQSIATNAVSIARIHFGQTSRSAFSSHRLRIPQTSWVARSLSSSPPSRNDANPFRGVWPIVATPFRNADESIDFESFEKSIDFFLHEIGVDGCTIVGVLGESNRLTDREREELIRIATSVGKNKICVGTSHAGTRATIELSQKAMELGAHSVMITPSKEPSGPDSATIEEYYSAIYQALGDDVPVVLQDHPASTGVQMSIETLQRIVAEKCPSVQCIKLESLPTPPKIRLLKPWIEEHDLNVTILTGLGALYGHFDLEAGSDGFMTGFAFPEILQALVREKQNSPRQAFGLYQQFLPLLVFEQQPGVGIRKEIYRLRGLMQDTRVRHPGKGIGSSSGGVLQQLEECIDFVFGRSDVDLTRKIDISKMISRENSK